MSSPLNPLVSKIRGMHPGIYDDMDDATLTKKVLAKYPQYSDLATGAPPQRPNVNMQEMPGTQSFALPAHGAGSLGPGQPEATPGMGTAGAAGLALSGAAVTPGVLPFLGAQAANFGRAIPPIATMAGINWLRKKIPAIPASAEYLPMFMRFGGAKPRPRGEPDATRENVPYAGEEEPTMKPGGEPDATRGNEPYAGEDYAAPEAGAQAKPPGFGFKQGRLVLSPEEAQSEDQIQAIAKDRASKRGMRYAGGIKPKGTMAQVSQ